MKEYQMICKECKKEYNSSVAATKTGYCDICYFALHKVVDGVVTKYTSPDQINICEECGIEYSIALSNKNTKYCSDKCRKEVRKRVNKKTREEEKRRFIEGDKEFILNKKLHRYKTSAKRRGYCFELTKEQFAEHYLKPCHYCGEIVNYIGLDRKDNSIGYTVDNVVDCCTECNTFKLGKDYDLFLNKISKIHNNIQKREIKQTIKTVKEVNKDKEVINHDDGISTNAIAKMVERNNQKLLAKKKR